MPPLGRGVYYREPLKRGKRLFLISDYLEGLYWREVFKRRGRSLEDLRYVDICNQN